MHILFITGEYPPMQGGVGAYTAALGAALCEAGVNISVLTSTRAKPMADSGTESALRVNVYPTMTQWRWSLWREVDSLAQQTKANWVHVQYQTAAYAMHPAINFAPSYWRMWTNKVSTPSYRVAWTFHDLLVPYLFPKAGERLRRWVTQRPVATSDLVVTTNTADYATLTGKAKRLTQIPIGSNIQGHCLSSAARRAQRQRRGYQTDDFVLGYFGFLNRSKGGITLIETLQRIRQQYGKVRLLMIGERVGASDPTNYAYLQEVERLITELGLQDAVQWTGHLPDDEVSNALASCDLLFMPYTDGASLRRGTLMAGLAHGCAVVTTTPQLPILELADGRDLLYVPPDDPATAAQTILHLIDHPARLAELRQRAYEQSRLFTWQAIASRHIELYAQDAK